MWFLTLFSTLCIEFATLSISSLVSLYNQKLGARRLTSLQHHKRTGCFCVSFVYYDATFGPKGHGSGLPLP